MSELREDVHWNGYKYCNLEQKEDGSHYVAEPVDINPDSSNRLKPVVSSGHEL